MNDFGFYADNKAFLMGKVVKEAVFSHEMFGEGFYELNIAVPRLSNQVDILPITISERLLVGKTFKIDDLIAVVGQFRSYNKITDEKSKLMLTVFVREILEEVDTSANPNLIELSGFVCKPPIFRMTPFKREICDILLAVNRAYNKSDYIPCIAWGRNARYASGATVGQKVFVSGRIQSREYTKKISEEESETRIAYEISISRINFEEDA